MGESTVTLLVRAHQTEAQLGRGPPCFFKKTLIQRLYRDFVFGTLLAFSVLRQVHFMASEDKHRCLSPLTEEGLFI